MRALFSLFSSFKIGTPWIVVIVFLFIAVIGILIINSQTEKKFNELLIDHLDDEIKPNEFYEMELNDCYTELAIRIFESRNLAVFDKNGKYKQTFLQCKQSIRSRFKSKVTVQKLNRRMDNYVHLYFSDAFCDFVNDYYPFSPVKDFYEVIIDYYDYLQENSAFPKRKTLYQQMDEMVIALTPAMIQRYEAEEKAMQLNLANSVNDMIAEDEFSKELSQSVQTVYNNIHQVKERRKEYVTAYNEQIQLIKENGGVAIVPFPSKFISSELRDYIASEKVLSHQKFFSMVESGDTTYSDVVGCYVIYDTYTHKFFVGKAKNPLMRAYKILTGQAKANSALLSDDYNKGHMMLVKIIPLDGSGYESVSDLQKVLVKGFNALYPMGYNNKNNVKSV